MTTINKRATLSSRSKKLKSTKYNVLCYNEKSPCKKMLNDENRMQPIHTSTKAMKADTNKAKQLPPRRSKRPGSKITSTKITKVLRVSLDRCPEIEEICEKIDLSKNNDSKDVYAFEYDSNEEKSLKNKFKRYHSKLNLEEDSGEDNNSMKEIMKKLRKMDHKKPKKSRNTIKKPVAHKTEPVILKLTKENIKNVLETGSTAAPKVVKFIENLKPITEEQINKNFYEDEETNDNFFEEENIIDGDIYDINKYVVNEPKKVEENHLKLVSEEIIDDFLEEDNNPVVKNINSTNQIKVLSNLIVNNCKTTVANPKNQKDIFNSTMNSTLDMSNPWRLNISNMRSNRYTFTVNEKSFVPNYDQDIVINSTFLEKSILSKKVTSDKPNKGKENKMKVKETFQSNMLNFISSSKTYEEKSSKQGGIFDDNLTSPRRVLGNLNFIQSTPYENTRKKLKSPNISIIEEKENEIGNLFGFSLNNEDSENINPKMSNKKILAKRSSPKNKKLRNVLFNDAVEVKSIDVLDKEQMLDNVSPSPDVNLLFQDIEDNNENLKLKKSRHSYERKPKRRRLPSVECIESDDESETHIIIKEKFPNKRTKKEEEEAARLASHYNSMFEEIEEHILCIV